VQTRNVLTAREAHIARLAGYRASNPEIALSCTSARRGSPATCGRCSHARHHLRSQLAKALPQNQTEPAGQVTGTEGLPAVVPGDVGYQDDYQVAGDDYPGMWMQP
jgi:hypothetical protein